MFDALVASILLSIRNISFKQIPSSFGILHIICIDALIRVTICACIYPFLSKTSDSILKPVVYSIISFISHSSMQYAFYKSENVAVTAAVRSLNIVFTLLLDSILSKKIIATKKQTIGLFCIILGTILQ